MIPIRWRLASVPMIAPNQAEGAPGPSHLGTGDGWAHVSQAAGRLPHPELWVPPPGNPLRGSLRRDRKIRTISQIIPYISIGYTPN